MSTATTDHTADETQSQDEMDKLASDAHARLEQLDADEARLSLDALDDEDAAQELKNVQSERASALAAIRQAELARSERDRRAERERLDAERARIEDHARLERELQDKLEPVLKAIDKAFADVAVNLRTFGELTGEIRMHRLARGAAAPWVNERLIHLALVYALNAAEVPRGLIILEGEFLRFKSAPLVESFPRVAPPEEKS
jgi:hypothetical protein